MSDTRSVLIVDDDEALRNALEKKFSAKGYTVTVCSEGDDAIEKLSTETFDVILTDLHMPVTNGFTVLESISSSKNTDTPVFVITNLGTDEFCDRALALGAKRCFVKSLITLRDVVAIVDTEIS